MKNITHDALMIQEQDAFTGAGWIKAIAPAKVNLMLAIGNKRHDAYHDVDTIMHTLSLHDVLYVKKRDSFSDQDSIKPSISIRANSSIEFPDIPDEENIIYRAIFELARAFDKDENDCCLDIRVEKNIPAQAGLGGGSSNAAATLVALCSLWDINADDPGVIEVAKSLGADVPFFLRGGAAYLEGRGDHFHHSLRPDNCFVALVKANSGVSTPKAYHKFDELGLFVDTTKQHADKAMEDASNVVLYNNLAPASFALSADLEELRLWLKKNYPVADMLLCGSGSSFFVRCSSFQEACMIVTNAQSQGYWARTAMFCSLKAAVSAS